MNNELKNKPKTNPIKANFKPYQTQFPSSRGETNPIQTQSKPIIRASFDLGQDGFAYDCVCLSSSMSRGFIFRIAQPRCEIAFFCSGVNWARVFFRLGV